VDIAVAIIKTRPAKPAHWLDQSFFALRELNRIQEAFDKLLPVVDRFSKVWTIPYNWPAIVLTGTIVRNARSGSIKR